MDDELEHAGGLVVRKEVGVLTNETGVEPLTRESHKHIRKWVSFLWNKRRSGRFVAMKSFDDTTHIAEGTDFDAVCEQAEHEGVSDPIFDYIPGKNEVLGLGQTH